MIKRLVASRVESISRELADLEALADSGFYPAGSLGAARLDMAIAICKLRLEIWSALLPEDKPNAP